MKRNTIFIFAMMTVAILFSGCTDFLQYTQGVKSVDNYWKTEADATAAADGLYFWTGMEGTTGRGFMWYENASDNMVTGRPKSAAETLRNFLDAGGTDRDVNQEWPVFFQLIHRCNDILKYVPSMNISQSAKDNAIGQAYFFRGFAYLWLAPWYADDKSGGLPIMTENTPIDSLDMPRPKSVVKNYDMIISDFTKAAALVPYFQDLATAQYGRPHKTACWAFAARAALYAAQFDTKYFATSSDFCDLVIDSKRHSLLAGYADVFKDANNYSAEYIWSIPSNQFTGSELPGVIFENAGWGYYNTWGYYQPTLELYKEFETGDTRRKTTIVYPGDTIMFIGHKIVYGVNPVSVSSTTQMAFGKYLSPFAAADCVGKTVNNSGDYPTTTLCPPVLRYADVLLMKAESMIWQGKNGDTWLNLVRNRAGLSTLTGATKANLKHERRCEFALEIGPYRFIDLVRWGDAKTNLESPLHGVSVTLSGSSYSVTQGTVVSTARTFTAPKNNIFAIPVSAITSSSSLTQNKDY